MCLHNQRAWNMFTFNIPGCKLELPSIYIYISLYYKIVTTATVFILLVHLSLTFSKVPNAPKVPRFCIVADDLIKAIPEEVGYFMDDCKINATAYADDINIITASSVGMQRALRALVVL